MIKSIVFLLYLENLSNNFSIISFYFGNLIICPLISYFVIQYIKILRGICQPQFNVRWAGCMTMLTELWRLNLRFPLNFPRCLFFLTMAMGWQIYPINCFITPCCFHLTLKCAIEQSGKMVNIKGQPHSHGWYSILVYFIYEMSRIKIVL